MFNKYFNKFEIIKKNENEYGRSWKEILEMFNEEDYMGSVLGLRSRAEILGFDKATLMREYNRWGIKIREDTNPKLLDLRDTIYTKTGLLLHDFFARYRRFWSEREIIEYLEIPRHKVEYVVQWYRYSYGKIYNGNRNTNVADRMMKCRI